MSGTQHNVVIIKPKKKEQATGTGTSSDPIVVPRGGSYTGDTIASKYLKLVSDETRRKSAGLGSLPKTVVEGSHSLAKPYKGDTVLTKKVSQTPDQLKTQIKNKQLLILSKLDRNISSTTRKSLTRQFVDLGKLVHPINQYQRDVQSLKREYNIKSNNPKTIIAKAAELMELERLGNAQRWLDSRKKSIELDRRNILFPRDTKHFRIVDKIISKENQLTQIGTSLNTLPNVIHDERLYKNALTLQSTRKKLQSDLANLYKIADKQQMGLPISINYAKQKNYDSYPKSTTVYLPVPPSSTKVIPFNKVFSYSNLKPRKIEFEDFSSISKIHDVKVKRDYLSSIFPSSIAGTFNPSTKVITVKNPFFRDSKSKYRTKFHEIGHYFDNSKLHNIIRAKIKTKPKLILSYPKNLWNDWRAGKISDKEFAPLDAHWQQEINSLRHFNKTYEIKDEGNKTNLYLTNFKLDLNKYPIGKLNIHAYNKFEQVDEIAATQYFEYLKDPKNYSLKFPAEAKLIYNDLKRGLDLKGTYKKPIGFSDSKYLKVKLNPLSLPKKFQSLKYSPYFSLLALSKVKLPKNISINFNPNSLGQTIDYRRQQLKTADLNERKWVKELQYNNPYLLHSGVSKRLNFTNTEWKSLQPESQRNLFLLSKGVQLTRSEQNQLSSDVKTLPIFIRNKIVQLTPREKELYKLDPTLGRKLSFKSLSATIPLWKRELALGKEQFIKETGLGFASIAPQLFSKEQVFSMATYTGGLMALDRGFAAAGIPYSPSDVIDPLVSAPDIAKGIIIPTPQNRAIAALELVDVAENLFPYSSFHFDIKKSLKFESPIEFGLPIKQKDVDLENAKVILLQKDKLSFSDREKFDPQVRELYMKHLAEFNKPRVKAIIKYNEGKKSPVQNTVVMNQDGSYTRTRVYKNKKETIHMNNNRTGTYKLEKLIKHPDKYGQSSEKIYKKLLFKHIKLNKNQTSNVILESLPHHAMQIESLKKGAKGKKVIESYNLNTIEPYMIAGYLDRKTFFKQALGLKKRLSKRVEIEPLVTEIYNNIQKFQGKWGNQKLTVDKKLLKKEVEKYVLNWGRNVDDSIKVSNVKSVNKQIEANIIRSILQYVPSKSTTLRFTQHLDENLKLYNKKSKVKVEAPDYLRVLFNKRIYKGGIAVDLGKSKSGEKLLGWANPIKGEIWILKRTSLQGTGKYQWQVAQHELKHLHRPVQIGLQDLMYKFSNFLPKKSKQALQDFYWKLHAREERLAMHATKSKKFYTVKVEDLLFNSKKAKNDFRKSLTNQRKLQSSLPHMDQTIPKVESDKILHIEKPVLKSPKMKSTFHMINNLKFINHNIKLNYSNFHNLTPSQKRIVKSNILHQQKSFEKILVENKSLVDQNLNLDQNLALNQALSQQLALNQNLRQSLNQDLNTNLDTNLNTKLNLNLNTKFSTKFKIADTTGNMAFVPKVQDNNVERKLPFHYRTKDSAISEGMKIVDKTKYNKFRVIKTPFSGKYTKLSRFPTPINKFQRFNNRFHEKLRYRNDLPRESTRGHFSWNKYL